MTKRWNDLAKKNCIPQEKVAKRFAADQAGDMNSISTSLGNHKGNLVGLDYFFKTSRVIFDRSVTYWQAPTEFSWINFPPPVDTKSFPDDKKKSQKITQDVVGRGLLTSF